MFNLVLKRAITNAQSCINNTRDINRATSVGEASWHVKKYTQPLAYAKLGLAEDIQIMSNACTNKKITIFGNKTDQDNLAHIFEAWEKIDVSVKPYEIIEKYLKIIQKGHNN